MNFHKTEPYLVFVAYTCKEISRSTQQPNVVCNSHVNTQRSAQRRGMTHHGSLLWLLVPQQPLVPKNIEPWSITHYCCPSDGKTQGNSQPHGNRYYPHSSAFEKRCPFPLVTQ